MPDLFTLAVRDLCFQAFVVADSAAVVPPIMNDLLALLVFVIGYHYLFLNHHLFVLSNDHVVRHGARLHVSY